MAPMNLLVAMLSALGLSRGLLRPQDSGLWSQHRNDTDLALPTMNLTVALAAHEDPWPPVPINLHPQEGLDITITQLGPVTAPSLAGNVTFALGQIERAMEAEVWREPGADLSKYYQRCYGRYSLVVTAFFGRTPNAIRMTKYDAYLVIEAIFRYYLRHDGAREILVSEVRINGTPVATFALRFSEQEQQSREECLIAAIASQ